MSSYFHCVFSTKKRRPLIPPLAATLKMAQTVSALPRNPCRVLVYIHSKAIGNKGDLEQKNFETMLTMRSKIEIAKYLQRAYWSGGHS